MSHRTKAERSEWYQRHLAEAMGQWHLDDLYAGWLEHGWDGNWEYRPGGVPSRTNAWIWGMADD